MKTVAVILARGGSKGIPKKNIQMVSDMPLISYSINCAKWSDVNEVWVSTDSSYIKTVSKSYGARVLDRPDKISSDKSSSESALIHFAENVEFDRLVFIQPTSPLLQPKYINEGLEKMNKVDSVFSVYREHFLPKWSLELQPLNFDPDRRPRRQDRKENYVENGAFYITTKDLLLKNKARVSGKLDVVEMSPYDSFQIDNWDDLNFVEKLL